MSDRKKVSEAIVEMIEARNQLLEDRDEVDPESWEQTYIDGQRDGLKTALDALSEMDDWDLPEWAVGVENVKTDDWEWYYPRAIKREEAIQTSVDQARDDLDGKRSELNVYQCDGPMPVRTDGGRCTTGTAQEGSDR